MTGKLRGFPTPTEVCVSKRRPIVVGNWKMNTDRATGVQLALGVHKELAGLDGVEAGVAPPFVYIEAVNAALRGAGSRVLVGAQDAYFEPSGAFTGEVSVGMVREAGASFVLTGHSERRHVLNESDELVGLKTAAVLRAGLRCILCIGEKLSEREAGQTDAVNERQLRAGLAQVQREWTDRLIVAYEPVWAIGTGKTATPADAQAAHAAIRNVLKAIYGGEIAAATRIQYGGSVKPQNARELFGQPDIDGGLIGGASLKVEDFVGIVKAAVPA